MNLKISVSKFNKKGENHYKINKHSVYFISLRREYKRPSLKPSEGSHFFLKI